MKRTRMFLTALVAVMMVGQTALFAQGTKQKGGGQRPTVEQMQEMQTNRMIKQLALDEATAAKFTPVYKAYLEALREARGTDADPQTEAGKKAAQTDEEAEAAIKERFARGRRVLDVQEKYYVEFRKFLSPQQIQKMLDSDGRGGSPRGGMNGRSGRR